MSNEMNNDRCTTWFAVRASRCLLVIMPSSASDNQSVEVETYHFFGRHVTCSCSF